MVDLLNTSISKLIVEYPYLNEFFQANALKPPASDSTVTMQQYIDRIEYFTLDEVGIDREELPENFCLFIQNMMERSKNELLDVQSVTICPGHDKDGNPEPEEIVLEKGNVVSIVGPTGSGKSRLLSDIEWLAQNDTPTGRSILVNGEKPSAEWRFSIEKKLVAQLSQNMNFVMDITVEKFLEIHCASRMIQNPQSMIKEVIFGANQLAGEPLSREMPVTALSGGQSRALMIADTAYVSSSPIILIDEIENAGINRKNAIDLLVQSEKIVLMATHDPVLALWADRRLVIKNGGISKVITTTEQEKEVLFQLEAMNDEINICREQLRRGEILTK